MLPLPLPDTKAFAYVCLASLGNKAQALLVGLWGLSWDEAFWWDATPSPTLEPRDTVPCVRSRCWGRSRRPSCTCRSRGSPSTGGLGFPVLRFPPSLRGLPPGVGKLEMTSPQLPPQAPRSSHRAEGEHTLEHLSRLHSSPTSRILGPAAPRAPPQPAGILQDGVNDCGVGCTPLSSQSC